MAAIGKAGDGSGIPDARAAAIARVGLFYATRDGQSRRIAERIAARLHERGITASPRDLAAPDLVPEELATCQLLAVVAAVRYGRHLPEAERAFAACRALPWCPPMVLLSVNLTARKPGRDTVEGNQYLRKSINRHRLRPVLAAAIAGRLDYQRVGWLDRQIIRLIMTLTGGPTDPCSAFEFTDWQVVDGIAAQIAALHTEADTRR